MFENALKAYEDRVRSMPRDELAAEHQSNVANRFDDMARITAVRLAEWEKQIELPQA